MPQAFYAALDRGDHRAAAAWLVQSHSRAVLGFCRALVRDASTAEDLAQDTFVKAFHGLRDLRRESSPKTWLLAIARNRCIDHLRRAQRAPYTLAAPDAAESFADEILPLGPDLLHQRASVINALESLDESARALVILRFRHGMEYADLAEVFGAKQGTIRMRLSRALQRMREALQQPDQGIDAVAIATPMAIPAPAAPPPQAARKSAAFGGVSRGGGGPPAPSAPAAPGAPPPPQRPAPPPSFAAVLAATDPTAPELEARLLHLANTLV